jgi:hypothetical protein
MRGTVEERFWAKVEKSEGCWKWTAGQDKHGYGLFWDGERMRLAHRISVAITTGDEPVDHLDHACRNPLCVKPAHLREVSRKQNMENRPDKQSNNKSGFRGVSMH